MYYNQWGEKVDIVLNVSDHDLPESSSVILLDII